jgi:12-oxophytodienoic acid reductase
LKPVNLGAFPLVDRIGYAPLTRTRAIGTVPQPAAAEYYSQRARKGAFMLSEGTSPSRSGFG